MQTASKVIAQLAGKTLVTAESLTGGGIGAALTAVPGASAVFKGGIISYTDEVKREVLGVPAVYLSSFGAVSAPVAEAMAPRMNWPSPPMFQKRILKARLSATEVSTRGTNSLR